MSEEWLNRMARDTHRFVTTRTKQFPSPWSLTRARTPEGDCLGGLYHMLRQVGEEKYLVVHVPRITLTSRT